MAKVRFDSNERNESELTGEPNGMFVQTHIIDSLYIYVLDCVDRFEYVYRSEKKARNNLVACRV